MIVRAVRRVESHTLLHEDWLWSHGWRVGWVGTEAKPGPWELTGGLGPVGEPLGPCVVLRGAQAGEQVSWRMRCLPGAM